MILYNKNTNIAIYKDRIIDGKNNIELVMIEEKDIYNLKITSGDILYIADDVSNKMINYLLSKISYYGLEITNLSNLISSER